MPELTPGKPFAGYVIERMLARGGMGIVYRARQLRPSRIVALKVISPELAGEDDFRERFEHESVVAASIEHSNVIPVYDVGESSGLLYIVMRYVDGTDLRAVIAADGSLPPRRAAQLLSQLTAALDAAHARGLVHRDVKPANVLIAREGGREHVYLTDFGLAKEADSRGRTRTGMFVGTLDYAAPEQFDGRRVDARTDIYAAGCVLYHMLTGRVPFPREGDGALMLAHLQESPGSVRETIPTLPPELDAVIARAMAKEPDDRYASAGDLGRDADAAAEGERATLVEQGVATGPAAPATEPQSAAPTEHQSAAPTEPQSAAPTEHQSAAGEATDVAPQGSSTDVAGPGSSTDLAGPGSSTDAADIPRRRSSPRPRVPAIASGSLAVVVLGILAATGAFSSGHQSVPPTPRSRPPSPVKASLPTTNRYANAALGISFAYPATWRALSLAGAVADFGIHPGPAETRCALVVERGAGPASGSQEARFAFVRARSAQAASKATHYDLLAIQALPAVNSTGVGLLRVDDGQGGDLGFFFRGRDAFVFDCVTPAATLTQVDQQFFRPLFASVRLG